MERPELHPVPVKSPIYHIGIDFVGPITLISSSGNQCILTVSDYFTRFGWAKALPTKEAKIVVSALKEVIDLVHVYKSALHLRCVSLSHLMQLFFIMGEKVFILVLVIKNAVIFK